MVGGLACSNLFSVDGANERDRMGRNQSVMKRNDRWKMWKSLEIASSNGVR